MEQAKKKKKITLPRLLLLVLTATVLLFSAGVTLEQMKIINIGLPDWKKVYGFFGIRENVPEAAATIEVFDVGAADCILITANETHVLIDAGNPIDGPKLAQTLRRRGIQSLDLVIATHPHTDHIGGMAEILTHVPAKCIWMPKPSPEIAPTSTVYMDLLNLLQKADVMVTTPNPRECWEAGDLKLTVFHCGMDTDNLNNLSLVVLAEYGDISFLLTGDAETEVEAELRSAGLLRPVTVLKIAHHGSKTSTSEDFLNAVTPQFAAISCGSDAPPAEEVLTRLKQRNISYQRTDLNGDLTYATDGSQLWIYTEKGKDIT